MKVDKKSNGMRVIPAGERKCIWMEAGVVTYKLCNNQFQCSTCSYDLAMSNQVKKEQRIAASDTTSIYSKMPKVDWMEKFRKLPSNQRKCRYMISGDVDYKVCPNNFNCGTCTFDQMMQDQVQPEIKREIDTFDQVAGFYISDSLYYFRNHLWIHLQRNGKYRIGIDDFARRLIGRVNEVTLPPLGRNLEFEEYGWSIAHEYGDLEMFSPISGVVDQLNPDLMKDTDMVVKEPYKRGWLMTIEPKSILKSNKNLFKGKEARAWMIDEADSLNQAIHSSSGGATLHDGAEFVMDISGHLDQKKWWELAKAHLFTK
jgi:glycine cleavage system H lipoate-binding protein